MHNDRQYVYTVVGLHRIILDVGILTVKMGHEPATPIKQNVRGVAAATESAPPKQG